MVQEDISQFNTKDYWNSRYEKESEAFDWFASYDKIKDVLSKEIKDKSKSIVMLGCGNSTLSMDMYHDGYHNILNIDYSEVVISQMQAQDTESKMQWKVMDIRDMKEIEDQSMDIAIDKGTMDALMCEKGDVWNPSEELRRNVKGEVDEVFRILKPCGKFIYVTFGQPHFRKIHLERQGWTLKYETIGDLFHYFVYVMEKAEM